MTDFSKKSDCVCESLETGNVRFYDNYLPSLPVGNYVANYTQRINPKLTDIDETYHASQAFSIQGPRYSLPPEDILSVYPADNTEGIFVQFLPTVVLSNRDFPWERNIFQSQTKENQAPWVALLLFVDDEKIDGQSTLLAPQVSNWQYNRTKTATITALDFYKHTADDTVLWPKLKQQWYETDEALANLQSNIIDITPAAFKVLIPKPDDLTYLAHARQIDPSTKDSEFLKIKGDGWLSVLMSKRLPDAPSLNSDTPGRLNIVHLVSLEGFEEYLKAKELPSDTQRIRMISLKSWSFTCIPGVADTFSDLMNKLLIDATGHEKSTNFVLPVANVAPSSKESYALHTLQKGYVPLQYQTQQGEKTFAWYRGPFTPHPIENFISNAARHFDSTQSLPFNTASAAAFYHREQGIFDISYSVAWEAGRLLGLADKCFAEQLLTWQQRGHKTIDLLLERQYQQQHLMQSYPVMTALSEQAEIRCLTNDFTKTLLMRFTNHIAPKLYQKNLQVVDGLNSQVYANQAGVVSNQNTISRLLQNPDIKQLVIEKANQNFTSIAEWLAELYLLKGVSFENLVPNADLLPLESIKFFYLDSNWLDCLIEGALSIGIQSSRDQFYQTSMKNMMYSAIHLAANRARAKLIKQYTKRRSSLSSTTINKSRLSGMLLRSAAVLSWPGMECFAYAKTLPDSSSPDLSSQIDLLRMERLSNDVLLCIWSDIPSVVIVCEPREGIKFGFEDAPYENLFENSYYLYLRSLEDANYGLPLSGGQYFINALTQNLIDGSRQIKIHGAGGLLAAIKEKLPDSSEIFVRDFITEMIKVPQQAIFATSYSKGK